MKKLLLLLALLGLATPAAAQNPFSLINFGSTAVDTNGGNKSNGTLRVTLATDGTNPTTVFKIDLSGTSANATAIKVDGSAVTQPVSIASLPSGAVTNAGTFAVQAAQSGTWTMQPGNTANTTAWLFAGGKTNNNAAPGATNFGSLGFLANASPPSWTEGNLVAGSVDLAGNTRVICISGCSSSGGSSLTDRATFTYGSTSFTAIGGVYNSSITSLTSGQAGAAALTPTRDVHTALYDASGTALAGQKTSAGSIPVVLPSDQFVADATGTLQSAAVANGNGSTLAVGGLSAVMLTVNCATCSGGTTVNFEGTEDGTNYTALQANQLGTNTIATTTTTSGITEWEVPIGAVQTIRARVSAYSAGTVTVTAHASSADYAPRVVNANVIGTVPISAASGALASGSVASGAIASGAVASGAFASGSISDGADVTLGAKADNKSTATDTTAITLMQVFKEISFMEQNPASRAVTNAGTFATQSAITAASGSIASGAVASGAFASGSISDGADVTLGAKGDAKSTATDTTAVTIMQVLKEISAMEQAPASRAVTNAGTFADQATLQTQTDTVMVGGVNIKEINGVTPLMGAGATGTGALRVNDVASSATGAAPPASATYIAGLCSGATGGFLCGPTIGDTPKVINISTATTTLMITGVSGRQVHIAAFHMVTAGANNVAWIEGTGATCGTGTAGMAGGTTAASGYNFAANQGIGLGMGIGDVLTTATTGDSVCLVTSAATQLSGFIKYAIY